MNQLSHLDIYKILEKSNCRRCKLPTCLAFAVAVMKGEKTLEACPHLETDTIERFEGKIGKRPSSVEDDLEQALAELQDQIKSVDFSSSEERLGANFSGNKLTIKCLSKDFHIDTTGKIISNCHTNAWVTIPLLSYVIHCKGETPNGQWVPLRELKNGSTWGKLFAQRCEKPLKAVVDNYTELFEDLIDIFAGKPVADDFSSDIAVVIHPLPKLPMLISYWKKEGDMDSALSLFFDASAEENLDIGSIYRLGVGLVTMFEKIALTHAKVS